MDANIQVIGVDNGNSQHKTKVRSSEIAQVKDMCRMEKRENYSLGAEGHRVHKVTAERGRQEA